MIYVFKTSVRTRREVKKLEPHLNAIVAVEKWNFDLEDCDRILRIESEERGAIEITHLLKIHQFYCEELT